MPIYLKFDNIKGDVTTEGFVDQIDLESMSFGVSRMVSMEPGNVKNREANSMPHVHTIALNKSLCSATPLLIQKALAGAEAKTAIITFVRTGEAGTPPQVVGTYNLEGAIISDYQFIGSKGAHPQEALQVSFTKFEVDFSGADENNKNGQSVKVGYDLKVGKTL